MSPDSRTGQWTLTDWLDMKSCRKIPALCPVRYLIPVRLCLQNKRCWYVLVWLLKSTAHGRSQQDSSTTILVFLSKRSPAILKMLALPFWDCLESTQPLGVGVCVALSPVGSVWQSACTCWHCQSVEDQHTGRFLVSL